MLYGDNDMSLSPYNTNIATVLPSIYQWIVPEHPDRCACVVAGFLLSPGVVRSLCSVFKVGLKQNKPLKCKKKVVLMMN